MIGLTAVFIALAAFFFFVYGRHKIRERLLWRRRLISEQHTDAERFIYARWN